MIVGFNVDSIDASKAEEAQGDLQIQYNPIIEEVTEATVNAFDDEVAKIEFTFEVNYEAGGETAATIEFQGNVLWKGHLEKVLESWEENGKLPEKVQTPLMNDLYRKSLSQAVGIADTLGLLPPIPTPRVNQQQ